MTSRPIVDTNTEKRNVRKACVLVVGQTPPPYHGQATMIQYLLDSDRDDIQLLHVRMAFSDTMDQVGRLQLQKLWHLLTLIAKIVYYRLTHAIDILYYPPAGPKRVPFYRDVITLLAVRWMFRHTVFHFQAAGLSELFDRLNPLEKLLGRWAFFFPTAGIRLSNLATDDVAFIRARHEFIIPNAASDESLRFANEIGNRALTTGRPLRILYLGTVCETKGILVLLQACQQLQCRGVSFDLHVVGSFQPASFQEVVRRRIVELGLEGRVQLHGQLINDKKSVAFAGADVFCFPTYYESEGFPCVLVEAMSFSLPIVSTRWRGIPSIVEEGVTGYLTEIQDAQVTAERLQLLASQPELRRQLGQAARDRYLQSFTKLRYQSEVARVFHAVLDRHK